MPELPYKTCARCPRKVRVGVRCCPDCERARRHRQDAQRPSSYQRYGPEHRPLRAVVMEEEDICGICKGPGRADDVLEHKVPVSEGGKTERGNVRRAHAVCNGRKARLEGFGKGASR